VPSIQYEDNYTLKIYASYLGLVHEGDGGVNPEPVTVNSSSANLILKDTLETSTYAVATFTSNFTLGKSNNFDGNTIEIPTGKTLEIKADTPVTISAQYVGDLFKVNGGTLILGENIIIDSPSTHWHIVTVYNGGTLIIRGATIKNANLSGAWHGYISCSDGGTIVMESGAIIDGKDSAIYVAYGGTFIMTGGQISGNAGDYSSLDSNEVYAGGVTVREGGTFIKTGGTIKDNHVANNIYNREYETKDWYLEKEEPRPDYYTMFTPRNNVMFFTGAKYGTSEENLTIFAEDTGYTDEF